MLGRVIGRAFEGRSDPADLRLIKGLTDDLHADRQTVGKADRQGESWMTGEIERQGPHRGPCRRLALKGCKGQRRRQGVCCYESSVTGEDSGVVHVAPVS